MSSWPCSGRDSPETIATAELLVDGLNCRGSANRLKYYLERDDVFELSEYLKLEAWPGPGSARARISFDPSQCTEHDVKLAITEPYYDALGDRWRLSPFEIQGFDPLAEP